MLSTLRLLGDLSLPTSQAVGLNHRGESDGMAIKTPRSRPELVSARQRRGKFCAFSILAERLSAPTAAYEKADSVCR